MRDAFEFEPAAPGGPAMWAERWAELEPHIDALLTLPPDARERWLAQHEVEHADSARHLRALLGARDATSFASFLSSAVAPESLPPLQVPGELLGAYMLVAAIGEGGMGSVWRARRSDGRYEGEVAIKLLHQGLFDAAAQARFRREGAILARLRHPGIAQLLDAGLTERGQPYLVLELVEGEPIDRWCDRQNLGVRERLQLFDQVLGAVAAAHAQLVIHRDLKPSNILVTAAGQVKLLDFGISRLLGDELEPALTMAGALMLTPAYAAPEQFEGGTLSLATDVYALGVVLCQLLTGIHPSGVGSDTPAIHYLRSTREATTTRASDLATKDIEAASAAERAQHRSDSPQGLRRRLRGDLDNILAKALAPAAADRYATVPEFAADLRRHLRHEPVSAREAGAWYRAARFVRRHGVAVGLSATVFFTLFIGLGATLWQAKQARAERDRAERMLARADAANSFTNLLLMQVGQAGHPMSFNEIVASGEKLASQQSSADPATHAYVLIALAGFYQATADAEKAESLATQARALAQQVGDRPLEASAQCTMGVSMAYLGEGAAGDALAAEAIQLAEGDPDVVSNCWQLRAYIASRADDGAKMLVYAQRVLASLESEHKPPSVRFALAQSDVADAYRMLGRYADADASYATAVKTLENVKAQDSIEASTIYNNWGNLARDSGSLQQALGLYRQALKVQASILGDDSIPPFALINAARVLADLDQLDEAWSLAERGVLRARAGGDQQAAFFGHSAEAKVLRLRGRYTEAVAQVAAAQRELDTMQPPPRRLTQRLALERAQLDRAQGQPQAALERLDALCKELLPHPGAERQDPVEQALLQERAQTLAALGRGEPALADARASLAMAHAMQRDSPSSAITGKALLTLAQLQAAAGEHDAATASARDAVKQLSDAAGAGHPDARAAVALAAR